MISSLSKMCPSVSTTCVAIWIPPEYFPYRLNPENSISDRLREPFGRNFSSDTLFLGLIVDNRANCRELDTHHAEIKKPGGLLVVCSAFNFTTNQVGEGRQEENLSARRQLGDNRLFFRLARDIAQKTVGGVKGPRWRTLEVGCAFAHFHGDIDGLGEACFGFIPRHISHVHSRLKPSGLKNRIDRRRTARYDIDIFYSFARRSHRSALNFELLTTL